MKDFYVSFPCCHPALRIPGLRRGDGLEEPAAGNLHGGVCEGGEFPGVTASLNGHETGNGGNSQGEPKANRNLLYSEVHGRNRFPVIRKKRTPALGGPGLSRNPLHPAGDASLADIEAQHEQFAVNARRAPSWVLRHHTENQLPNFRRQFFPTDLFSRLRNPTPVQSKTSERPSQD